MEGPDEETEEKGRIHIICPICFEKKKMNSETYLLFCCGKEICRMCAESYKAECIRKSLKMTCVYCRAELVSSRETKGLLQKQGKHHVLHKIICVLTICSIYIL